MCFKYHVHYVKGRTCNHQVAHSILVSNQIQYIRKAESALRHDLPFCRLLRP